MNFSDDDALTIALRTIASLSRDIAAIADNETRRRDTSTFLSDADLIAIDHDQRAILYAYAHGFTG